MKKGVIVTIVSLLLVVGVWSFSFFQTSPLKSPVGKTQKELPLQKYTFENLKKTSFPPSDISLDRPLREEEDYISQVFYYVVDGKRVSGQMNVPTAPGTYPVVVMFRGFVPREIYAIGVGTKHAGEVLAQQGLITLAPDFLGYGESDMPSQNGIEERFQTYTTAITLLSSLDKLNEGLMASYSGTITADTSKVGIWGHSNGGHIALSVLAITGKSYPTALWAPVTKPFPYSILYFTDEFDDNGKALRRVVANFEDEYDIELYSPTNFLTWINAPIQLHQGGIDDAVPLRWSNQFVEKMEELEKDITYFVYPGADHNLLPDGWSIAVQRSLGFYNERL